MARETAAERKAREAQGSPEALQQAQRAEQQAEPDYPTVPEVAMESAIADAPQGKYGDTAEAPVGDYPERPYADALTPEHAEVLRAAGQHPDQQ